MLFLSPGVAKFFRKNCRHPDHPATLCHTLIAPLPHSYSAPFPRKPSPDNNGNPARKSCMPRPLDENLTPQTAFTVFEKIIRGCFPRFGTAFVDPSVAQVFGRFCFRFGKGVCQTSGCVWALFFGCFSRVVWGFWWFAG